MFIFTSRADKNIPLNSTIKSARASQNNYILRLRPDVPISQWSRVSKFSGNGILWVSCLSLYFDSYNVEQCVTDCCSRLPEIYLHSQYLKVTPSPEGITIEIGTMHVSPHSPQPGSVQFQFLVPTFLILLFFLYSTIRQGINKNFTRKFNPTVNATSRSQIHKHRH